MGGAQSSSGWVEGSREGELAIITGGAAGIGYGVAEKCVHLGACAPTASQLQQWPCTHADGLTD
jgi:hypothetical protein